MNKLYKKEQCYISGDEIIMLKKLYNIELNKVCLAMERASLAKYKKFFIAIQGAHDEIITQMRTGRLSVPAGCAYLVAYRRNY